MKKSNRKIALQNRIEFLEHKQKADLDALKFQLEDTYENLKPIHLLTDFVQDLFVKPNKARSSLLRTIASSTGSLIIKKLIVGKTHTFMGKIMGTILQIFSYKVLNKYINK